MRLLGLWQSGPALWLALLMLCPRLALSGVNDASDSVFFAGVAFTGAVSDSRRMLPHTRDVLDEGGLLKMNRILSERLENAPPSKIRINTTGLARLDGTTSATVLALALDRETVLVERIGSHYKLLVEIAAQALFFDFRDREVRASLPLTVQHIETYAEEPDSAIVRGVVAEILLGSDPAGLASGLADSLREVRLPGPSARRIQIVSVEASESARRQVRVLGERVSTGVVGHEFSKILSSGLSLPLLPYRSGHAIGGTMAARFAEGRVYNISIPEPDYEIHLVIEDFRGRVLQERAAFRQELFGAYYRVTVSEPLSETRYFDQTLRFGATRTVPSSQETFDRNEAYYETLLAGLDRFTTAIDHDDKTWSKQQADAPGVRRELRKLEELIEKCR